MTEVTPIPVRRRWYALSPRQGAVPPWMLVVTSIISVQIGAAFAKQLFDVASPTGVVFIRTLLTGLLFLAMWRPNIRQLGRRGLIETALYGVNITVMMLSFYSAIERVPLGITVTISFAGPLALAVFGSRRAVDLMWAAFAAVGIIMLSPITNVELDPLGILFCLLSATSWATYILLGRRVCRVIDGNAALAIAMIVAAIAAAPFGIVGAAQVLAHPNLIVLSLVVALLSSAVPFALEFEALRRIPPRVFGLLLSLEPVTATIVGFVVLHEALGLRELAGILLVTLAAAATARSTPTA